MGLDRNTVEGAQVAFVSALDGSKPRHRRAAWLVLFLLFGLPLLLTVIGLLRG